MATLLTATADSPLRHVMTPNPRTLLLLPTIITGRAVQRGLPANLRLVARRRDFRPMSPNKIVLNRPNWPPPHTKLRRGGTSRRVRQPSKARSSLLARDERP